MKRYIAILFAMIALTAGMSHAQKMNPRVDSLVALLPGAHDTLKPRLYYEISMNSRFSNPLQGIQYALRALDAAADIRNRYHQTKAMLALASNERMSKMPDAALGHYMEALDMSRKYRLQNLEAECYNRISYIYIEADSLTEARQYNGLALNLAKRLDDSVQLSDAYVNMGVVMHKSGKSNLAVGYLQDAFELRKKCFDPQSSEYLIPMWHLVDVFMDRREYARAKNVTYMILNSNIMEDRHDFLSRVWYKMAQVYYSIGELDSALIAGKESLDESMAALEPHRVEASSKLLSSIYSARHDYREAANICQEYIVICDTMFNTDLNDQLKTIHFTSEYLSNEKNIEEETIVNRQSLAMLGFVLVALIGSGIFFTLMMRQNRKIKKLHKVLSVQKTDMDRSLTYAHAMQKASLPDDDEFGTVFSERFVLYIPRDIVSGDFYWSYSDSKTEILVVADCTGHGIPGAMLTMIGTYTLQSIAASGERDAATILESLRSQIISLLAVNTEFKMKDGMDISLAVINKETLELDFAGAYNNLVYIRNEEVCTLKATRCPIGEFIKLLPFKSEKLKLRKGDEIYLMSDGYASQFGGRHNMKLSQKKLQEIILERHNTPMDKLCDYLKKYLVRWKGKNVTVDDVTIAGFRL